VIRTLLALMTGAMLAISVPTSSEAGCSFNCRKPQKVIKKLEFMKREASNSFDAYRLSNMLTLPKVERKKFPVIILLHACGGITGRSQNDLARWGNFLLKNGYGILGVDHLGSRNVRSNCSPGAPLGSSTLLKDVYDAITFLSEQAEIDKSRIFTLGFSLGAMTSGALASPERYKKLGNNVPRPRAVAGLYGGCYWNDRWLEGNGDIPVLWLVGGKDYEAPPLSCGGAISALKGKGLMTFHTYPDAGHCWDCAGFNGYIKTAGNGEMVTYKYDPAVTKDSEQRVLNFFNSFESQ
jgi:dienelactone hydrolase